MLSISEEAISQTLRCVTDIIVKLKCTSLQLIKRKPIQGEAFQSYSICKETSLRY